MSQYPSTPTSGLLAIGDAARAMSPVDGVGIQDAVAAANILAAPLAAGHPVDRLAAKVQRRRMLPSPVIQGLQRTVHKRVIGAAFRNQTPHAGTLLLLVSVTPVLQAIPARILGLGLRREHIRSSRA